jgi:hypothetical protein
VGCLAASPAGAFVSDALAAALGLPHSALSSLLARCDKASLVDFLRLPGGSARTPEEAWRHGLPLVIRHPLSRSAPGQPVAQRCDSQAQAGAAVGRGMQLGRDPSQRRTERLLASPLAIGPLFQLGMHACPARGVRATQLWRLRESAAAERAAGRAAREAGAPIRRGGGTADAPYDEAVLVDATAAEHWAIVAYGVDCATRLGLNVGGASLRIAVTSDGPRLLAFDQGLMPDGGAADALAASAISEGSWDPFSAAIAAAVGDDSYPLPPPPRPRLAARLIYPPPPSIAGRVLRIEGEAALRLLPTYVSHALAVQPGQRVEPPPEPCRAALAVARLLGDEAAVERDAEKAFDALRVMLAAERGGKSGRAQCAQQ